MHLGESEWVDRWRGEEEWGQLSNESVIVVGVFMGVMMSGVRVLAGIDYLLLVILMHIHHI